MSQEWQLFLANAGFSLVLALVVGFAVYKWQKGMDQEGEERLERLRSDLGVTQHRQIVGFDREVEVLTEAWRAVAEIREAADNLYSLGIVPAGAQEQRKAELLRVFDEAEIRFRAAWRDCEPYCSEAVLSAMKRISVNAYVRAWFFSSLQPGFPVEPGHHAESARAMRELASAADVVRIAIGERLGTTEVLAVGDTTAE